MELLLLLLLCRQATNTSQHSPLFHQSLLGHNSCRGIHAIVPKYMFQGLGDGKEYSPRVMQGTSVPSKVKVRRKFATTLLAGRH